MNRILAIIFCLFSAFLYGLNVYAADTAVISGRVTVEDGAWSIYQAKVFLYDSCREIIDSAFSSQNGSFQFSLTAGEYYLAAEKDNYIREFYPSAYQIAEARRIVAFAGQVVSVNFSLDRGGWLGGIFDYLGRDIDIGLVTAIKIDEPYSGWHRSLLVSPDRPQNYVLNGLIPGAYKVAAMASFKKTIFYQGVENFENAEVIYVERNAGVPDISFLLEPVGIGQVSGRVYDLNTGAGLSGITIFAYQWREFRDDPNMQSVLTGQDGNFVFDLAAGYYYFYMNCDECFAGSGRIAYYYNNQFNPMLADKVEVLPDVLITGLDFLINPNISHNLSISGNIVDAETGQGLEDVTVTALDYHAGYAVSSTYSISTGSFSLENLPAGDYLLMFSGSNVIPFFYRSTESWQNGEVIVLNTNHTGIESEAITQDYGNLGLAISGQISTPAGPAPGARIYAYPVGSENPIAFGHTSASGEYAVTTGLVPGAYRVACDLFGYNLETYPYEIHLDLLENPVAENIDFLLEPAVTSIIEKPSMPGEIEILGNYPNPFNAATTISVFSGSDSKIDIDLSVYNILGQHAGRKNITLYPGINYITWRSGDFEREVSSGLYFYRIEGFRKTYRMVYLK